MPGGFVYVRLDELEGRTLDDAAADGDVGYYDLARIDPDAWTTDPTHHRNPFDSEAAEYLRVERSWAEENLEPVSEE